ncbi:pitrilysin family protein [Niveibacterium sp. SC-1]|uniref:M16 family metallopeptidase n=1 Tax=Niveibacterium sp. SC-1 TaxID=3135646 RepID=UPI00311E18C8
MSRLRLVSTLALCWLALLCAPLQAAAPALPEGVTQVTAVEGVTEYRLANGLRVLLAPDESKPTAAVNVTYLVGSRFEGYGETGMAHLLEHLLFKGTPTLAKGALVAELKRRGMRFNGTTSFDRTNYYEIFSASDDNMDWALGMEADRMVNSFIARSDLDSEMTVVRNEMESGENDPGRVLWQKMAAAAYQWHAYGKATIGARSDVENVDIANLQAFYRKYYQPDNAVLTVAGKFDPARVLARIQASFGAIARPERKLAPTYTVEPVQDGERRVTLQRVGDVQIVGTLYHTVAGSHPDAAPLELLSFVLGDTPSGRLHRALVESKKAVGAGSSFTGLAEPGYTGNYVQLSRTQSRETAQKVLIDTAEDLARHAVTAAELARAKTAYANAFEDALDDPASFGVSLSSYIALGDWRLFFLQRDRIKATMLADVQRVAQTYFKPSNRTLGIFVPTDKPDRVVAPAAKPLAEALAGYTGGTAVAAGEDFDPSPANIGQRTRFATLGNGAKLAMLPKKTRGGSVNGVFVLHMGDEKSLFAKSTIAQFTAAMLNRGAAGRDRQALSDALDAAKAQVSISGDGDDLTVRFETRREHLATTLDLIRDQLRKPDFPAGELEQLRGQTLSAIEAGRREPSSMASRALGRHDNPYPKGDTRYVGTLDEELAEVKAVKRADLLAFQQGFYGADHAEMAIVGDFDAAALQAQLERNFGDWKSRAPYKRIASPYHADSPAQISLEAPDKANAIYLGSLSLPVRDDAPEWLPLVLGNRILGGGGLKSRIADRLRQKDGISYSSASSLSSNAFEANAGWSFYAIYAPQNLQRLKSGLKEEIARLLKDGVGETELAEVKSGLLQEITVARTRDGTLAGLLASHLQLGRDMNWDAAREQRLAAVTVDEVNAALRRYLQPESLVEVYAGDFAKATKDAPAAPQADAGKTKEEVVH